MLSPCVTPQYIMTASAIIIVVTGRYPTFRANSIARPSPKLSRTTFR